MWRNGLGPKKLRAIAHITVTYHMLIQSIVQKKKKTWISWKLPQMDLIKLTVHL